MFSPRNPDTACKMYSPTYFVALFITVFLIVIGLILSKKFKEKQVRIAILVIGIFACSTEVIKQIFLISTYGWAEFEPLPMYFCSMLLYCPWFALSKNKIIKKLGTTFLTMGGIFSAIAFFCYPSSCIPNYPIYHFMCLRTMLFHGSMIYIGLLILITGFDKPKLKDFKYFVILIASACIFSYFWNMIFDANMMYISEPLGIPLVDKIYDAIPSIYPFIIMTVLCTAPFFGSYGIYLLIVKIFRKTKSK